jgi:GNAT superfamily N-acetyltransferase
MTEFIWVKDIRQHPALYLQMFGVREISNALGVANHHDDSEEWLLAVQNGNLLGFSGYEISGSVFILKRSFVYPKYRRFGLYRTMIDMRLERAKHSGAKIIQATCTYMSRAEFEKRGFKAVKHFKKYTTFRIVL